MSSRTKPAIQKKKRSPGMVLLLMGLFLGVGIAIATRLPKEKERSSWVVMVHKKVSQDEQLAMSKPKGSSAAERMIRHYQRRLYLLPKKVGFWILLGKSWVRKARGSSEMAYYQHAKACIKVALHLSPGNTGALNLQGLVLIQQHKFREAIQVAKKVLKKRHDDAMAWGIMSDAFLEMGQYKQASMAVERMAQIKPNLPSYIRASHLMWLQGDIQGARKLIEHAFDAGRGQKDREPVAWVLTEGAMIFWHAGNYKEAQQGFDMALQYFNDYPPALVGKAQTEMALDNVKHAIQLLQNAYNRRPLARTAWLLGDARMMEGDEVGAQKAYAIVEKLGQEDRRVLALFWATKNRKTMDAIKLIREEYKVRSDIYTEDVIAWLMYRLGQHKDALIRINRATIHGTKDALLWFHKGAIYIANQKVKEGRKLLKNALQLNPHFDMSGVKEAKALLKKTAPTPKQEPKQQQPKKQPSPRR